jgi:hypothetical protein
MRAVTGTVPGGSGRRVRGGWVWGGWVWGVSGVVTAALLAAPAAVLTARAGTHPFRAVPHATMTRTFTMPQRVNAVTVDSYGGPVQITVGAVSRVKVIETIAYDKKAGGPPAVRDSVTDSVSGRRLTLADPACGPGDCTVTFTVTVPRGTRSAVSSAGGPVSVSGTAARTDIDSGGGVVNASQLGGPLTVSTDGGPLLIDGLAGTLSADSGSGFVDAQDLTSAGATVTTEGGPAVLGFAAAPRTVTVRSGGGTARLGVPGGPYALTADSGGGPESVEIPTDPAAGRWLAVSTDGGTLLIAAAVADGVPGGPAVPGGPVVSGPGVGTAKTGGFPGGAGPPIPPLPKIPMSGT